MPVLLESVSRGADQQSRLEAQAWASPALWGPSRCSLTSFFSITPCWSILSTGVQLGQGGKKNRVLGADRAPFFLPQGEDRDSFGSGAQKEQGDFQQSTKK